MNLQTTIDNERLLHERLAEVLRELMLRNDETQLHLKALCEQTEHMVRFWVDLDTLLRKKRDQR